jgi:hypothetical protein
LIKWLKPKHDKSDKYSSQKYQSKPIRTNITTTTKFQTKFIIIYPNSIHSATAMIIKHYYRARGQASSIPTPARQNFSLDYPEPSQESYREESDRTCPTRCVGTCTTRRTPRRTLRRPAQPYPRATRAPAKSSAETRTGCSSQRARGHYPGAVARCPVPARQACGPKGDVEGESSPERENSRLESRRATWNSGPVGGWRRGRRSRRGGPWGR